MAETTHPIQEPPAASQAPGELELFQAFVNTVGFEGKGEMLATPQDLERWLAHRGLLPEGTQVAAEDLRRAWTVRRGLRVLLRGRLGTESARDAVRALDLAIRGACLQPRFAPDGSPGFAPAGAGFEAILGRIAAAFYAARLDGNWKRLRVCGACGKAYFALKRPGGRKWCSRRCGDRIRARAYRRAARKRRARSAGRV